MSVTIQTVISCDHCGKTFCDADCSYLSAEAQRLTFRDNGWRRRGGKDICGSCWPKMDWTMPKKMNG